MRLPRLDSLLSYVHNEFTSQFSTPKSSTTILRLKLELECGLSLFFSQEYEKKNFSSLVHGEAILSQAERGEYFSFPQWSKENWTKFGNPNLRLTEEMLKDELSRVVSISKTNPEKIKVMKDWCKERAVPASNN